MAALIIFFLGIFGSIFEAFSKDFHFQFSFSIFFCRSSPCIFGFYFIGINSLIHFHFNIPFTWVFYFLRYFTLFFQTEKIPHPRVLLHSHRFGKRSRFSRAAHPRGHLSTPSERFLFLLTLQCRAQTMQHKRLFCRGSTEGADLLVGRGRFIQQTLSLDSMGLFSFWTGVHAAFRIPPDTVGKIVDKWLSCCYEWYWRSTY